MGHVMTTVALTIVVTLAPMGTTTGLLLSTSVIFISCDEMTGLPGPVVIKYGEAPALEILNRGEDAMSQLVTIKHSVKLLQKLLVACFLELPQQLVSTRLYNWLSQERENCVYKFTRWNKFLKT